MKATVLVLLFGLSLYGCDDSGNTPTHTQPSPDSTKFYPTRSFFENQLNLIPAMKKNITAFFTVDGKLDSIQLDPENFAQLMHEFLSKDITAPDTKKHYRETIFQDASTGSYTLSYTAVDTTVPVKGLDVLLNEQTNQVQRIFIRSLYHKGDTTIMEQHNWNTAKGFQISQSKTNSKGYTSTKNTEVRWEK